MQQATASGQDRLPFNHQGAGSLPPEGVIRYGNIEVAWVQSPLDGRNLLQVAAPTVADRKNLRPSDLPVEVRAESIQALLQLEVNRFGKNVLQRLANQFQLWEGDRPAPRSAEAIISTLNTRPVIQVRSSDRSRPLTIVTVTQTDVDFYSETPDRLAQEWRRIFQAQVDQLEQSASLEAAQQGLQRSLIILSGAIATTGVFGALRWWAGRRRRTLQDRNHPEVGPRSEDATCPYQPHNSLPQSDENQIIHNAPGIDTKPCVHSEPDNASERSPESKSKPSSALLGQLADRAHFLKIMQSQPALEQQLTVLRFLQWLLIWLTVFVWYSGVIGLTYTLPFLTPWRDTLLREPFRLLLIWFAVNLALRVNRTLTQRLIDAQESAPRIASDEALDLRTMLRTNTIGGALQGLITCIVVLTGMLLTLSAFGLSTRSVLAWSAILGLAVSFGTQSLVKDVVNGCLILLEDQFAVGDVINIGGMGGLVEQMSLRSTRLRSSEGQLITIPNSQISEVINLTRTWSRVDFTIEVAYDSNPDKVLNLLNDISQRMYAISEWREKMPSPPEVLGIDRLSHSGILIRVWIKTVPLQQWAVGREYRLRVKRAFEAHGIMIGKPQWVSHNMCLEAD